MKSAVQSRSTSLQPPPRVPRLALTAMEAPAALGVSHDFFKAHIASELRWVRVRSKKLVSVRELERWLEQNAARVFEEAS
jgi:hypothetical protein